MITLSTGWVRFLKGVGAVLVAALVSFLGDSANLTGIMNPAVATLVAGFALVVEGWIKDKFGKPLFGAASYSD